MEKARRARRHGAATAAGLALMLIAACADEADSGASTVQQDVSATATATGASGQAVDDGGSGDGNRPAPTMTESDRLTLEMAERACEAVDFPTFFRAYGGSWAVRERYTAGTVQFGVAGKSRPMPRRQYLDRNLYPIAPMDNSYATSESVRSFDASTDGSWRDLTYVELEFNTANDNRRRIDWTPGIFEKNLTPPPPELEEGLGRLVRQTGDGGKLLFWPTASCWELVEDIRNPMIQP